MVAVGRTIEQQDLSSCRNRDIVQFRTSALLELYRFAGLDFEEGSSLFGFGDGKSLRALLDFNSNFSRNVLESVSHLVTGIKIYGGHDQQEANSSGGKPTAKVGNGDRHVRVV